MRRHQKFELYNQNQFNNFLTRIKQTMNFILMIKTVSIPSAAAEVKLKLQASIFTKVHEVQFLCWLSRQIEGDIAEIGCNSGGTTSELAFHNLDKLIHAIDYTGIDDTMCLQQKKEKPSDGDLCRFARDLPNVRVYNMKSKAFKYDAVSSNRPIGLVFIDGDHSFDGVKTDTDLAMSYLKPQGGVIAWHDYKSADSKWLKVKYYIDNIIGLNHDVFHVLGTAIALLEVPPARVSALHI